MTESLWGYRVGDAVWLEVGRRYAGPGTIHRIHHDHPPCVLVELEADPNRRGWHATHLYAHDPGQLRRLEEPDA